MDTGYAPNGYGMLYPLSKKETTQSPDDIFLDIACNEVKKKDRQRNPDKCVNNDKYPSWDADWDQAIVTCNIY